MNALKHLSIFSGDPSSDVYAAELIQRLRQLQPELSIHGIGGPKMRALVPSLHDQQSLALVGLNEVIKGLPRILALRKTVIHELKNLPRHTVLLLDCPGFNMSLLKALQGHDVIYAIPPQTWAWHTSRIKKLKRFCQSVWVLYPFEKEFYAQAGLDVQRLRHPLLDKAHLALRPLYQEPTPRLALLPGSRKGEHEKLMPELIKLSQQHANIEWVWVEHAPGALKAWYAQMTGSRVQGLHELPEVHGAIAASGTVTLELALMGIPMIIVYKVAHLTAYLARWVIQIPHIGLPNILLQASVCPELLQENFNPSNLEQATLHLLQPEAATTQYQALKHIRQRLESEDGKSLSELLWAHLGLA